jgi:EAL domain-containing protein (putative c-di-GMP-specific phosphodiesterase class I)/GAF domain-containing protein
MSLHPPEPATLSQRLELISDLSLRLGSGGDFSANLRHVAEKVCRVLHADVCIIREYRNDRLLLLGAAGPGTHELPTEMPVDQGIGAILVGRGQPVIVTDAAEDTLTAAMHAESVRAGRGFLFRAFAGTAMIAHGRVVGALGVYMVDEPRPFTKSDVDLLQIIANTIGVHLENARLVGKVNGASSQLRLRIEQLLDDDPGGTRAPLGQTIHPLTPGGMLAAIANDDAPRPPRAGLDPVRLEYDLRRAQQQMELDYQPLHDTRRARVVGYEALLRWNHPVHGRLYPDQFIPLAEERGLINSLGFVVAHMAASVRSRLHRHDGHVDDLFVAINVSVLQLADRNFLPRLSAIVDTAGVPPAQIAIEITESAVLHRDSPAHRALHRLSEMGFPLFVDDFGAGYSSLSHLIHTPVRGVKIDKVFMPAGPQDTRRQAMFRSITRMLRDMGVLVIAEGVETEFQRDFATASGADLLQGYAIGRPHAIA